MKKLLFLFILTSLLPFYTWAQYFITLDKTNTFHAGNSYLIDVPLKEGPGLNLFIQDKHNLIPLSTYHDIYENEHLNRYDTVFVSYNRLIGKAGLTRKILEKELVQYALGRWNIENPIDTLVDADDRFINYRQLAMNLPTTSVKDSILVYYTESGGSGEINTEHFNLNNGVSLGEFVKKFEHKYHVNIGQAFSGTLGHEDDWEIYLTLSGLSPQLRIAFIDQRIHCFQSRSNSPVYSTIHFPYWIYIKDYPGWTVNKW